MAGYLRAALLVLTTLFIYTRPRGLFRNLLPPTTDVAHAAGYNAASERNGQYLPIDLCDSRQTLQCTNTWLSLVTHKNFRFACNERGL